MGYYDVMQVCKKNGHQITAYYNSSPNHRQKFCDKCGCETTIICENCKAEIRGRYHIDGAINFTKVEVPLFCHKCGKSYPWKNVLLIKNTFNKLISPIKYIFDTVINLIKK